MQPYFRTVNYRPKDAFIKKIIWVYGLIFVVTKICNIWFGSHCIENQFALSWLNIQRGKVWTLFTYSFLHADFLHFLFNSLMFYVLARFLLTYELRLKQLLCLYMAGIFVGGVFWLMLHMRGFQFLIGASAGIMALLAYFCHAYPEKTLSVLVFFIFPVQIKAKWLIYLTWWYQLISCVFYELQGQSIVANSAHLGGMLCGFFYYILQNHFDKGVPIIKSTRSSSPQGHYQIHIEKDSDSNVQYIEFDIFRKLKENGLASLTDEEKAWLEQYRKL